MIFVLLLIPIFFAKAQLPEEYRLLLRYRQNNDPALAYRILRSYPQAVFRDDLILMLAKQEASRKRKAEASRLLEDINPSNLSRNLREEYQKLWVELGLDLSRGFLKSPVLFREAVAQVSLPLEEALRAWNELYRFRFYRESIVLLESFDFQLVCYNIGKTYMALRERDKALETFEKCNNQRAQAELAFIYFEMGQRSKTEQILSSLSDETVLSQILFRLGRLSLHTKSYSDAITYLQRMQPSYERDFNLGLAFFAVGNYQRAAECFQKAALQSSTAEQRSSSHFWAYKSLLYVDREKAQEHLIKASNGAGFYHAVASSALGLPIASKVMRMLMEDESVPRTAGIIKSIWNAGFPEYARLEAFKRLREMSASDILSISQLDPFLAVRLAVRKHGYGSFLYNAVAFPRPFYRDVLKASQTYNVEPALIYAVIRQESLFDPYAVSVANARGLMQLIDSTAAYVSKREGINIRNIYDPETNILLGTAYLRYLLEQWEGDLVRTLASYNAGPNRVRGWQRTEDPYLFIETIPITETREYVKRVLYNYYVYSELLK